MVLRKFIYEFGIFCSRDTCASGMEAKQACITLLDGTAMKLASDSPMSLFSRYFARRRETICIESYVCDTIMNIEPVRRDLKKAGLYQEIPHTDLFLEGFCTFKFPIGNTIMEKSKESV